MSLRPAVAVTASTIRPSSIVGLTCRAAAAVALLLGSLSAAAQAGPSMGLLPNNANFYKPGAASTIIDFGSPAREGAYVNTVTLYLSKGDATDCKDSFRVKILRPNPDQWGAYETVAESAPFDAINGYLNVDIGTQFVEAGDVIAVTYLRPTIECGSPMFAKTDRPGTIITIPGSIPATGSWTSSGTVRSGVLAARASWDGYVLEGVVPIVGSAAGANGSFFRTSVQLTNPGYEPISGWLSFRPANTPDAEQTAYADFELEPGQTVSSEDLGTTLGITGLGTLDIWSFSSAAPLVTTRVFNDLGANGTLGFTQPMVKLNQMIPSGESVVFSGPSDVAKYRMNVGVRTLWYNETKLYVRQLDEDGSTVSVAEKTYPRNFFEQVPLAAFVGGAPVANGSIEVYVEDGDVIVYASTTDNKTNDSSMVIASRPE